MRLKKSVISRIISDKRLKVALQDRLGIDDSILTRFLKQNSPQFCEYNVLLIIGSYLGVDEVQDLLEESEVLTR